MSFSSKAKEVGTIIPLKSAIVFKNKHLTAQGKTNHLTKGQASSYFGTFQNSK